MTSPSEGGKSTKLSTDLQFLVIVLLAIQSYGWEEYKTTLSNNR